MEKSIASHISSKGKDKYETMIIGAVTSLLFRLLNATRHASLELKDTSSSKRLQNGFIIFGKSLMNLLQNPACPKKLQIPLIQEDGGSYQLFSIFPYLSIFFCLRLYALMQVLLGPSDDFLVLPNHSKQFLFLQSSQ